MVVGSRVRWAVSVMLSMVLVACSSAADATGQTVEVAIPDSAFELSLPDAPSGSVTFVIDNVGTMVHEFEVFAGAEPGQVLPLKAGVADTTGLEVVDEVEDILPGSSVELTVDLEPGTYLLICNLPAHYAAGNWAEFTVTG